MKKRKGATSPATIVGDKKQTSAVNTHYDHKIVFRGLLYLIGFVSCVVTVFYMLIPYDIKDGKNLL